MQANQRNTMKNMIDCEYILLSHIYKSIGYLHVTLKTVALPIQQIMHLAFLPYVIRRASVSLIVFNLIFVPFLHFNRIFPVNYTEFELFQWFLALIEFAMSIVIAKLTSY